jgi:hypothetical protein
MSNASHTSNESRHSLPHMPSVPSCPNQRDSITLTEVPSSSTAASFPLTIITNYKQNSNSNYRPITSLIDLTWDSYLVVSPMSAETILALDPMLNATIHITAYRLATTVHEQTAQYAQKVTKAKQKIEQLKQINQLTRLTTL